jgi:hypothetical protein
MNTCTSEIQESLKVNLQAHTTLSTIAAALNVRTQNLSLVIGDPAPSGTGFPTYYSVNIVQIPKYLGRRITHAWHIASPSCHITITVQSGSVTSAHRFAAAIVRVIHQTTPNLKLRPLLLSKRISPAVRRSWAMADCGVASYCYCLFTSLSSTDFFLMPRYAQ